MRDAVDILNEQLTAGQRLNIEIGRLRQRESMLEARIEVLELTIARLQRALTSSRLVVGVLSERCVAHGTVDNSSA